MRFAKCDVRIMIVLIFILIIKFLSHSKFLFQYSIWTSPQMDSCSYIIHHNMDFGLCLWTRDFFIIVWWWLMELTGPLRLFKSLWMFFSCSGPKHSKNHDSSLYKMININMFISWRRHDSTNLFLILVYCCICIYVYYNKHLQYILMKKACTIHVNTYTTIRQIDISF